MVGLLDNDIIVKLSMCDLLKEAIELYDIDPRYSLETFKYRIINKPPRSLVSVFNENPHLQEELYKFYSNCLYINNTGDFDFLSLCSEIENIDAGEALLLSYARLNQDTILFTADKKFFRAISDTPEISPWLETLNGRIVCIEQVILSLIQNLGYDYISKKVKLLCEYDTGMRLLFRDNLDNPEDNCREGMQSNIRHVKSLIPDLLSEESVSYATN